MRIRSLFAIALLAVSFAAVPAVAQLPVAGPAGTLTLTISDLPASASVPAGQAHNVAFKINVDAGGFQCAGAGQIVLDVALTNAAGAPAGVSASVDPPNVTITVPPNAYGLPTSTVPGGPGANLNASGSATLKMTIAPSASGNYAPSITVSHAAGPVGDQCIGTLPDATVTGTQAVTITGGGGGSGNGTTPTPSPGGVGGPGGNGTGNNTGPPAEPAKPAPGFEPLLLAGAGAVAFVVQRRRREN